MVNSIQNMQKHLSNTIKGAREKKVIKSFHTLRMHVEDEKRVTVTE